jgi:hypothetical protein
MDRGADPGQQGPGFGEDFAGRAFVAAEGRRQRGGECVRVHVPRERTSSIVTPLS